MTRALLGALAAVVLGCHGAPPVKPATVQRTPLLAAGALIAAVEQAGTLYLFAPDRATIERGGALIARIPAPDGAWADAGTMPALDEAGTWVVARTAKGSVWRITTTGELEPIHDLLGLPPRVRSLGAAGGTLGLALDDSVAVLRDRAHIARFINVAGGEVVAGRDRIAIRRGPVLDIWDLTTHRQARITVPTAIAAGFTSPSAGDRGRLVVATPTALFVEAAATDGAPAGELHRIAAPAELHRLAIAGARIWIATGNGVFVVDGERLSRAGVEAAITDRMLGLSSGDVILGTPSSLTRLALERPDDRHAAGDPRWAAEVAPIYQRVCARCHSPSGDAGVDLSTAAAWRTERGELVRRVVETRTMPPAGTPLSDTDRAALAAWLK